MSTSKSNQTASKEPSPELVRKVRTKLRLAMCLALLGGVLVATTAKDVMNGHFTEKWLTTSGKIVSSSIIRIKHMQFPQKTELHTSFIYSYPVDGQTMESKDDSFQSEDDKKVGEIISRFPDGKEITVHYLQAFPGESYFDYEGSTRHSKTRLFICLGGLILLMASMQLMFKLRREVKAKGF